MIVDRIFPHDDNALLKRVQHERYASSVEQMYRVARDAFVRADAILQSDLLIAEKARLLQTFDHRVMRDAHDILAAAYRYANDDGGQYDLFVAPPCTAEEDLRRRYTTGWSRWLTEQLAALANYPEFVRSVVECALFADSVMGRAAEHTLCSLLVLFHGLEDWAFRDGYARVYVPARA